ncbi:radical SAM protein [bacterium]|nr:radical SAM protein [bacterium]
MKTVFITTQGCPKNKLDSQLYRTFFTANGWQNVIDYKEADVIILNTCALFTCEEERAVELIKEYQSGKKPDARLAVCGCLPLVDFGKKRIKEIFDGLIFTHDTRFELNKFINAQIKIEDFEAPNTFKETEFVSRNTFLSPPLFSSLDKVKFNKQLLEKIRSWSVAKSIYTYLIRERNSDEDKFFILISSGCTGRCSYCCMSAIHGRRFESKSTDKILREFRKGLSLGYRRFELISQDTGAYGIDINMTFPALLKMLLNEDGEYEIGIGNLNPRWLIKYFPELKQLLKTDRIYKVQCTVQSGNDRILKLMNRPYNIDAFKRCVSELHQEFPDLNLNTHFMVGFPSETESEFKDSLQLLDNIPFNSVFIYEYSGRPDTRSYNMPDQIPDAVKRKRAKKMYRKALLNLLKRKFKMAN